MRGARVDEGGAKKGPGKRLAEAAKATIFLWSLSASAAIAGDAVATATRRMLTSIADRLVVPGIGKLRHSFAGRLRRRDERRFADESGAKDHSGRSPDHKQATRDVRPPHDLHLSSWLNDSAGPYPHHELNERGKALFRSFHTPSEKVT